VGLAPLESAACHDADVEASVRASLREGPEPVPKEANNRALVSLENSAQKDTVASFHVGARPMSILKQALKRQIDSSGILLLKAASALSDQEFGDHTLKGASMAWTLGHISALQDWSLHRVFLKDEPEFGREKREALKGGRLLREGDHEYTANRREVEATFEKTQSQLVHYLHTFDEATWNASTPSGCRFPTYGALWEHLAVHNFWHLGAIAITYPRIARITLLAPRFYSVDHNESV
jgi:hypothetical protein